MGAPQTALLVRVAPAHTPHLAARGVVLSGGETSTALRCEGHNGASAKRPALRHLGAIDFRGGLQGRAGEVCADELTPALDAKPAGDYRTRALGGSRRRCCASASIFARTVASPLRHATSGAMVRPARVSDSQTK